MRIYFLVRIIFVYRMKFGLFQGGAGGRAGGGEREGELGASSIKLVLVCILAMGFFGLAGG